MEWCKLDETATHKCAKIESVQQNVLSPYKSNVTGKTSTLTEKCWFKNRDTHRKGSLNANECQRYSIRSIQVRKDRNTKDICTHQEEGDRQIYDRIEYINCNLNKNYCTKINERFNYFQYMHRHVYVEILKDEKKVQQQQQQQLTLLWSI